MLRLDLRGLAALVCSELLILSLPGCGHRATLPSVEPIPGSFDRLQDDLKKPYLTLFEIAPNLNYSADQISRMQEYLKQAQDYCVGRFEEASGQYDRKVQEAQKALKKESVAEGERHDLHCTIQSNRAWKGQADVIAQHAIPVAYDNKQAKLELIQKWPAELRGIQQSIADNSYKQRHWGDIQDIGFREVETNQKDDIKDGQEAIDQLKRTGLMPKEVEDPAVTGYVARIGQKIAANSDLQVHLKITVLNSKEINAFALPGGFVFIERGLLEATDDESQLAGVIAHEMSHVIARHGHKLMKKATIASIMYQAAQVAAVIFTGGAATIGTYYALQYGFYGIGLALNLTLLGVSREYEQEADQLGIQYTWKSGYDPTGFIRFFDKIASKEGYVNGMSWFRSHPPFYQRMVETQREIAYMPKLASPVVTTTEFQTMKEALAKVTVKAEESAKDQPSLLAPEQGCPASTKLVFEPDQPIETICSSPKAAPALKERAKEPAN